VVTAAAAAAWWQHNAVRLAAAATPALAPCSSTSKARSEALPRDVFLALPRMSRNTNISCNACNTLQRVCYGTTGYRATNAHAPLQKFHSQILGTCACRHHHHVAALALAHPILGCYPCLSCSSRSSSFCSAAELHYLPQPYTTKCNVPSNPPSHSSHQQPYHMLTYHAAAAVPPPSAAVLR
jgi:hypothetical protein